MPALKDVCRYIRSKNAGPFWITVDLFFDSPNFFALYKDASAISADSIARIYGVDARWVRRFAVEDLSVVKISYPRPNPQGWMGERDMHSGQQCVALFDLQLEVKTTIEV